LTVRVASSASRFSIMSFGSHANSCRYRLFMVEGSGLSMKEETNQAIYPIKILGGSR
jgi:hypothetical protein